MTTTAPLTAETFDLLESGRHVHGIQCWWNHLEARWFCSTTPTS